jgi:flagellar motility protein MotE (MotC chaperone)
MLELVGHLNSSEAENRDLQAKIDRLKTAHDSLRAVEVKKLAKIIESMKPEKAAAMLANRKSDLITELIFKVKPKTAAKLMESLPVDKRSQVTGWVMQK